MHWTLEKIEALVDKLIPYALLALLVLIVLEFTTDTTPYQAAITLVDETVLAIFVLDLCFKYHRVKTTMQFFRTYWLELIAVFPFYLVIRAYTTLLELSRGVEEGQKVLHEAALLREARLVEEGRLLREARVAEEEARLLRESNFFWRMIRTVQRGIRLLFARLLFVHKLLFHARKKRKK